MSSLSSDDYSLFQDFLQNAAGILLGDNKQYLVTSRLSKLMADQGISSLRELVTLLDGASQRSLREAVIDAMTTNETLWFRDMHPFEIFRYRLLPELQRAPLDKIRIWSSACSSGQEPFSLSMLIEEYRSANLGVLKVPVDIVATDLSRAMLKICQSGEYDVLSLGRGLSEERKRRFFESVEGNSWRVKDPVRQRVRFQALNLKDSFLPLGKFDVVFCRNVLIYFSAELKADILRRIHATLKPGGYLVLGASEGLSGMSDLYEMVQCNPGIIYRAR